MTNEIIQLSGKITYILFHSETTFYTVAKFVVNDEQENQITITGTLPDMKEDILYQITGNYTEHPKYGMQFQVKSYQKCLPNDGDSVVRYLSGPQFVGIGKKAAENVVKALGNDCLVQIKENPDLLKQVDALSEKQILAIQEGMRQESDGLEELVQFMNTHGIGIRNLIRLNQTYGKDALEKIKENPYRVIDECDGFGFITADKIAMSLGFEKDDERRLYAYLVALTMKICVSNGDSYVRYEVLEENFRNKTKGIGNFEELLDLAIMRRSLVKEENRIYPITQYDAENTVARFLRDYPYADLEEIEQERIDTYLNKIAKETNITYDALQVEAIHSLFEKPIVIMTGGPGTGKTTVVNAMVSLFHSLYPNYQAVCVAPTGRAAKRLAELTNTASTTIHSLLKWDLESNTFGKNEEDPIEADLLIIDEFSMVDVYLFSNLLKASRNVKRICIIGDEDQLPSVGPGCVLRDLIRADLFPLVRLNHIYRQKSGSDVIQLAHAINHGEVNFEDYAKDVKFFSCNEFDIKANVLSVVNAAIEKGYSIDDIQVLSPMHNGNGGIDVLNNALQAYFNPPREDVNEVHFGYLTFREGDKILQLKNQPDNNVFNGDIGRLVEIIDEKYSENRKTTIVVNFDDNFVEYQIENWTNITLAYCVSVHKSQGSEYPIVIMPFARRHIHMLQRKLIYTAVTRARNALILLGDENAFKQGIATIDTHPRETTLASRLQEQTIEEDPFA